MRGKERKFEVIASLKVAKKIVINIFLEAQKKKSLKNQSFSPDTLIRLTIIKLKNNDRKL